MAKKVSYKWQKKYENEKKKVFFSKNVFRLKSLGAASETVRLRPLNLHLNNFSFANASGFIQVLIVFEKIRPVANVIKLFTDVSYDFS